MHLADPDPICDLGLGQALHETQDEDLALAFGELRQVRGKRGTVLGVSECHVVGAKAAPERLAVGPGASSDDER